MRFPSKRVRVIKKRILQIYLILFVIVVICKFRIPGKCKLTGQISDWSGDSKSPDFMGLPERNIIVGLGMYAGIFSEHSCVTHTVTAVALVGSQIFSYRLPRSGPVVSGYIVSDIEVSSGLIKLIENISQDTSVCTGFCKAVSACIV